ncbi:MAG: helix-turn-helix transcriptional regulator [Bacteroidales bacterium]|nr:helix-turn-helix transcriptional regulator [Bacteroidales bacterium]
MNQEGSEIENKVKEQRLKLGSEIRTARETKGYSQDKLAELMNINSITISKIENGKFSITVDYLVRLSILLDYQFVIIEK